MQRRMHPPEVNEVRLCGRIRSVRQRWTPDGEPAVVAELVLPRPPLGAPRASQETEQPIPLRARGAMAGEIARREGECVRVSGMLRRRYYRRDNQPCWGQVEVWVGDCMPAVVNQEVSG